MAFKRALIFNGSISSLDGEGYDAPTTSRTMTGPPLDEMTTFSDGRTPILLLNTWAPPPTPTTEFNPFPHISAWAPGRSGSACSSRFALQCPYCCTAVVKARAILSCDSTLPQWKCSGFYQSQHIGCSRIEGDSDPSSIRISHSRPIPLLG